MVFIYSGHTEKQGQDWDKDLRVIHIELMVETMRDNELTKGEGGKRGKARTLSGIWLPCMTVQH